MPAGFAAPGVLFAGNSAGPDRAFYALLFRGLAQKGVKRYVEVGVGSFAATQVIAAAGVDPSVMETSDVTLFTSILGTVFAGNDLADLGVRVDGRVVELDPSRTPIEQAAHLLWRQLVCRYEARPEAVYWVGLVQDLYERQREHELAIADKLEAVAGRLKGIRYTPRDMWEHIRLAANDPDAVILAAPPSYKGGFETFFDTKGRLTWDEPPYEIFNPDGDMQRLHDEMLGKPALLVFLQEDETGKASSPRPVFAHPLTTSRTAYVVTNRPDDVFAITGGPRVATKSFGSLGPWNVPMIPFDHEVTKSSTVELQPVKSDVADYYRGLWIHRLHSAGGSMNMLVIVDGYAAGVIGYSVETMARTFPGAEKWNRHVLMRFAFGAPNKTQRLTRLATMIALRKQTVDMMVTPANSIFLAASVGVVTVEMTRHPEAKGLRGLMKLADRQPHRDGHKLVYSTLWTDRTLDDIVVDFVTKEEKWQQSRR